ncbi:MAG: DUF2868 domain-containing protein [Pseudomonadales bacterium]
MKFADYVVLEQVRALDEKLSPDRPLDGFENGGAERKAFALALGQRANRLIAEHEWRSIIAAPAQWYYRLTVFVCALFALLGVVAVLNALSGEASSRVLNIYGLLLVLLGFNFISLVLWLLGCLAKLGGLITGTLGSLPIGIENMLRRFQQKQGRTAYSAWQQSHFSGNVGVWRISLVSHSIWLSYLGAGLICLLVLFSIRQYDFIWGSTLLSGGTFVDLTRALGAPLQILGVSMPDTSQVLASQSGSVTEQTMTGTDIRRQWAWFLLGAIAVYGLLPRLLAAIVSWLAMRRAESLYRPDFYLPYYVELKHRMQANVGEVEVVDADTAPIKTKESVQSSFTPVAISTLSLPDDATVAGFELEAKLAELLAVNITGRESHGALLQTLSSAEYALAVVVDLNAAPDRGTTRKLIELFSAASDVYLILVDAVRGREAHERQRLADWYQLAGDAAVPVDHVYRMSAADLAELMDNR